MAKAPLGTAPKLGRPQTKNVDIRDKFLRVKIL